MYKVPEEWKLSDFLELSNDEKLKWLYNGVKNAGGGSDLPEVTSEDNGDVLTVVEGAWAKAAPSGGSDTFDVFFEYNYETHQYSCNKTANEICNALVDGKIIRLFDDNNWVSACPVVNGFFMPEDGEETFSEITLSFIFDGKMCFVYTVEDDDNVTTVEHKETLIEEQKLRVDIQYDRDLGYYTSMTKKGEVRSYNNHIEGTLFGEKRITLSYSDALGFYYFLPGETPGQIILRSINYVGDDTSQRLEKTDYVLIASTS